MENWEQLLLKIKFMLWNFIKIQFEYINKKVLFEAYVFNKLVYPSSKEKKKKNKRFGVDLKAKKTKNNVEKTQSEKTLKANVASSGKTPKANVASSEKTSKANVASSEKTPKADVASSEKTLKVNMADTGKYKTFIKGIKTEVEMPKPVENCVYQVGELDKEFQQVFAIDEEFISNMDFSLTKEFEIVFNYNLTEEFDREFNSTFSIIFDDTESRDKREAKAKKVKDNAEKTDYKKVFSTIKNSEYRHDAVSRFVTALKKTIKATAPDKFQFEVEVGAKSAATTGEIIGACAMFYPYYAPYGTINGNFSDEVLKGDAFIKGQFNVATLMLIMLNLIVYKPFRIFTQEILDSMKPEKKEESNDDRK